MLSDLNAGTSVFPLFSHSGIKIVPVKISETRFRTQFCRWENRTKSGVQYLQFHLFTVWIRYTEEDSCGDHNPMISNAKTWHIWYWIGHWVFEREANIFLRNQNYSSSFHRFRLRGGDEYFYHLDLKVPFYRIPLILPPSILPMGLGLIKLIWTRAHSLLSQRASAFQTCTLFIILQTSKCPYPSNAKPSQQQFQKN